MKMNVVVEFTVNPSSVMLCKSFGEVSDGNDRYDVVAGGSYLEVRPQTGTGHSVRIDLETLISQAVRLSKHQEVTP